MLAGLGHVGTFLSGVAAIATLIAAMFYFADNTARAPSVQTPYIGATGARNEALPPAQSPRSTATEVYAPPTNHVVQTQVPPRGYTMRVEADGGYTLDADLVYDLDTVRPGYCEVQVQPTWDEVYQGLVVRDALQKCTEPELYLIDPGGRRTRVQ